MRTYMAEAYHRLWAVR